MNLLADVAETARKAERVADLVEALEEHIVLDGDYLKLKWGGTGITLSDDDIVFEQGGDRFTFAQIKKMLILLQYLQETTQLPPSVQRKLGA